jgi:bifunctional aspartokinase / homoserine dehydrogenase 1
MSDYVIRLGGSDFTSPLVIQHFAGYSKPGSNRIFVVVSSIPEIHSLIHDSIDRVFLESDQVDLAGLLSAIYKSITNEYPTGEFIGWIGKITSLLHGISLAGDYSSALKDLILCYGEKLSTLIIGAVLAREGIETRIVLPEDFEFRMTEDFGNATHLSFSNELFRLPGNTVYIIPGSYGITQSGKIARAGNFASDYTAASLAAWLGVQELIIWGLGKEFYCADPFIVENPGKIMRLTYSEASELAYFDHYSFHPRTVEPLEEKHIPIKIFGVKSFCLETIINTETFVSEEIVKGVAYTDDISLLKLDGPGVGLKPGILAKVTTELNDAGINIKSVITSQVSINFILGKKEGIKAYDLISQLGFTSVRNISLIDDVSLIGVVGHGMQQNYGVSAKIFGAVAEYKINVLLSGSGASDLVSYLIVKQSDRDKSIKGIYKAFFSPKL